jgi:hypothetical protein
MTSTNTINDEITYLEVEFSFISTSSSDDCLCYAGHDVSDFTKEEIDLWEEVTIRINRIKQLDHQ